MENYESHELTAVSFGDAVPASPDRRVEERQTTLLRIAKLVTEQDQRLCMVRNISRAGAMLRLYQPLEMDARVQVEITPDCPVPATVIWVQDDLAGVAFAEPIDVIVALRGGMRSNPYRRAARTPRLQVHRSARMCVEDTEAEVILCDLSLNGAKIATEAALADDTEIAILVEGLHPLMGRVRWCHDGRAGVQFDVPLAMDALAGWVGSGEERTAS